MFLHKTRRLKHGFENTERVEARVSERSGGSEDGN